MGSGQPCFSATCAAVNPLDKYAFRENGNIGIFPKWQHIFDNHPGY